ncbi:hypothetical protein AAC387_Pa03g4096 [Persea americana]
MHRTFCIQHLLFGRKNRTYLLYFAQERDAWVSGQSLWPLLPVSFRYIYVRDSGLSTSVLIEFDCYEPSGEMKQVKFWG